MADETSRVSSAQNNLPVSILEKRQAHIARVRDLPRRDWTSLVTDATVFVRGFESISVEMIRAKYNFSTFIAYKLIKKLRVAGILEKGAKNRWNVVAQVASVTPSSTEKKKRRKSREHSWETCIPVAEALVRKNGSISHRVLRRATGIGAGTACKVLQELERKKILAPYDPVSRMRIALNGVGKTTPQKVGDESYKRPRHPDPAITTEKAIVWIKERRDEFGKTSLFGVMLDTLVGEVERLQALEKAIKGHLR